MAENEESEWVGCQWVMQGFCGRRTVARQGAENETRRPAPAATPEPQAVVEPTAAVESTPPAEAVAPPGQPAMPATPAKRPKRQSAGTSRKDAWSAARKAAAAKRTRRPAA